jgi:hypothetical protein
MATEDEFIIGEFCEKGRLIKSKEEMKFRQWNDKGYVHCRVMLTVGVCDRCDARSFEPGSNKIFDEAFRREYEKRSTRQRAGGSRKRFSG